MRDCILPLTQTSCLLHSLRLQHHGPYSAASTEFFTPPFTPKPPVLWTACDFQTQIRALAWLSAPLWESDSRFLLRVGDRWQSAEQTVSCCQSSSQQGLTVFEGMWATQAATAQLRSPSQAHTGASFSNSFPRLELLRLEILEAYRPILPLKPNKQKWLPFSFTISAGCPEIC